MTDDRMSLVDNLGFVGMVGIIASAFNVNQGVALTPSMAHTNVKKRGRLLIISHMLSQAPDEPLPEREVTLPRRQMPGQYQELDLPLRHIPTPF